MEISQISNDKNGRYIIRKKTDVLYLTLLTGINKYIRISTKIKHAAFTINTAGEVFNKNTKKPAKPIKIL